jgi:hypothetical protein
MQEFGRDPRPNRNSSRQRCLPFNHAVTSLILGNPGGNGPCHGVITRSCVALKHNDVGQAMRLPMSSAPVAS